MSVSKPPFHTNLLKGYLFKDLLVVLLDESGYEVYPYGYESFIAPLKRKIHEFPQSSTTQERVRSTPDLLIYDTAEKAILLVEVKSRDIAEPASVGISGVSLYRKYWSESVLVVIINGGNYFYAQRVSKLKGVADSGRGDDFTDFNLQDEFQPLDTIFKHVDLSSLEIYKQRVTKLFSVFH